MTGPTVAVVPIRSLSAGKTRLSGAIDAEARAELIRLMLGTVLRALSETPAVDQITVVSPEPAALAFAANTVDDVELLAQPVDRPGLLPALELGRAHTLGVGAARLLVLFGDLPRVSAADVAAILGGVGPVVIAPDRDRVGTNGLVLAGPAISAFAFRFGERSFSGHLAEAQSLGFPSTIVEREGLSFDLDTPRDLASWPGDSSIHRSLEIAR